MEANRNGSESWKTEIIYGTKTIGRPSDLLDTIVDFTEASHQTLDVAVQELESRPIADALISARQRGVSVRVVLEENYLSVQRPLADPWSEGGNNETNRHIYDALQRAKIEVKKEYPTPSLFKLMLFRMSRSTMKLILNENYRDYTYYREHGWFESNYYYPVKLNPFKKLIGRFFDMMATQMARGN